MKLGTKKPKLPPPRVGATAQTKKESTTMAKNTGTAIAEDSDDAEDNDDEDAGGMPRHLKHATYLRKKAFLISQRKTPKGIRRLRQWLDDAAENASDDDKRVFTKIAKAIDEAASQLRTAADLFEELSDTVTTARNRKPGIEVGTKVAIAEKHAKKYAELLMGNLAGLKVVGFRKTHAMVEYDANGDTERLLVPRAHLAAE